MEEFVKTKYQNTKERTLKNYIGVAKRLNRPETEPQELIKKLRDTKKTIKKIEEYKPSVQSVSYSVIIGLLKGEEDIDTIMDIYKEKKNELVKKLSKRKEAPLTEKQKKCLKTWDEYQKIRIDLYKQGNEISLWTDIRNNEPFLMKGQLVLLTDYVIASLYTLQSPRRFIYNSVKRITEEDFLNLTRTDRQKNYFVEIYDIDPETNEKGDLSQRSYFHYGKQKSKTAPSKVKINSKKLIMILNDYFKYNKSDNLLLNYQRGKVEGISFTPKAFSTTFYRIFKGSGTKCLRHAFHSGKKDIEGKTNQDKMKEATKIMEQIKEDTDDMGHSVSTASSYYMNS